MTTTVNRLREIALLEHAAARMRRDVNDMPMGSFDDGVNSGIASSIGILEKMVKSIEGEIYPMTTEGNA